MVSCCSILSTTIVIDCVTIIVQDRPWFTVFTSFMKIVCSLHNTVHRIKFWLTAISEWFCLHNLVDNQWKPEGTTSRAQLLTPPPSHEPWAYRLLNCHASITLTWHCRKDLHHWYSVLTWSCKIRCLNSHKHTQDIQSLVNIVIS